MYRLVNFVKTLVQLNMYMHLHNSSAQNTKYMKLCSNFTCLKHVNLVRSTLQQALGTVMAESP